MTNITGKNRHYVGKYVGKEEPKMRANLGIKSVIKSGIKSVNRNILKIENPGNVLLSENGQLFCSPFILRQISGGIAGRRR